MNFLIDTATLLIRSFHLFIEQEKFHYNQFKKLQTMKVAQQINESSYDSYKSFIKALKPIVKDNFKSFVPNKAPDPNEYKEINLEGVIFGDFPQEGEGIYVIKFDFQDWDNPESLYKDMVYVLDQLNQKRESGEIDMTTIIVHLVHYMD